MTDTTTYPRPLHRLQAFLIDSVVLGLLFFSVVFLVRMFELQNAGVESLIIIVLWASFEPCCIALTGGSVGHHLTGLRVRCFLAAKPLPLARAYLRFFTKAPLATLSLLPLFLTTRHRALHDFIARSLVVYRQLPESALFPAALPDHNLYHYPSPGRRLVVISGYIVATIAGFAVISTVVISDKCTRFNICTSLEALGLITGSLVLIFLALIIIRAGWRGSLYGALKKSRKLQAS